MHITVRPMILMLSIL